MAIKWIAIPVSDAEFERMIKGWQITATGTKWEAVRGYLGLPPIPRGLRQKGAVITDMIGDGPRPREGGE